VLAIAPLNLCQLQWGAISIFSTPMSVGVASGAERDEVLFGIIARSTAKLFVVYLQVHHRATQLTTPPIATENLLAKVFVRHRI
jgi:hypothetical protein